MSSNIGEIICEAVDTIVSKRLEGLNYNITQTCTIIDDTYKAIGRYTVKNDNMRFEAYSTDTTFKKNDQVLILIPNNDYNEQKIILNKISIDDDLTSSVAYVSPLKNMLKFSNNIIEEKNKILIDNTKNGVVSLLANENNNEGYLNPEKISYKLMYSIDFSDYNNYTKLGISIDFQSWLKEFGTVSGDYGIEFLFFDDNTNLVDKNNKNSTYRFTFNVNDILGNPYNFQTYFTQEKVLDITYLKNLKTLEVYFYQKGNFMTEDNKYIIKSVNNNKLPDNLFARNLQLYVGYSSSEYVGGNTVTINTADNLSFSILRDNNIKNINLYWVRQIDNDNYEIINKSDLNDKDIEVYWVRQDIQSDLDLMDIVGSNWIYSTSEITINNDNKFHCTLDINNINQLTQRDNIKIKAVLRVKDNDNWKIFESNILTFQTEDPRIDQNTVNVLTGLSIQCEDNGYSGIYFIYGSNNKIIDESKGTGDIKNLVLYYNGKRIGSNGSEMDLNDIKSVKWTVWKNTQTDVSQSMLNFPDIEEPKDNKAGIFLYESNLITLKYNISDIWYPNKTQNTITCIVETKDGVIYKASKELLFGRANNNNSNYNVVIEYLDASQNAYEIKTESITNNLLETILPSTKLIARLYDINGLVNIESLNDNEKPKWNWNFLRGNNFVFTEEVNNEFCTIQLKDDINLKQNYTIIQVTCKIGSAEISAYKPIAIKTKTSNNKERASTLSGSSEIIYNNFGKPIYNSSLYQLNNILTTNNIIPKLNWELDFGEDKAGLPELKEVEGGVALAAYPTYINNNKHTVCLSVYDDENTIYWSQPILIMQSPYELSIINNWESTDYGIENGIVKAATITAGKQLENGKFQGIILGDIKEDTDDSRTGLYGINDGIVSFSLTSNGLATFQKNNTQILFGADNQILSCDNILINKEEKLENLLLMDLDERYFTFSKTGQDTSGLYLSPFGTNEKPYLSLKDLNSNKLLTFDNDNFYLQSPNYTANKGLKIDVKNGIINIGGSENQLLIGKLKIDNNGEVFYNNKSLSEYINSLIQSAIKDL